MELKARELFVSYSNIELTGRSAVLHNLTGRLVHPAEGTAYPPGRERSRVREGALLHHNLRRWLALAHVLQHLASAAVADTGVLDRRSADLGGGGSHGGVAAGVPGGLRSALAGP